MPTKGSKEQDAIVRAATRDACSDEVEFARNTAKARGPHHYGKGMIGGGSDTEGTVTPGEGRAGAGDETGA